MNQRTMVGVQDFTGHETGTLTIEGMVSRHPQPRYSATCKCCGAKQTVAQKDLAIGSAVCRASGCGREAIRQAAEDTPRRFAQREARQKQDRIDAIARDVQDKVNKIARLQRERLLTGIDVDFPYDPDAREMTMTAQEADAYNRASAAQFLREHPEYYPTQKNLELIEGYLQRHGMNAIVSAKQLELVYKKLDEFAVLERKPVAEPKPEPYVNLSVEKPAEPPKRREPEMGWDLRTGEKRLYTPFEIDRLSAADYRRAFRLYGDRAPVTPTHAAF